MKVDTHWNSKALAELGHLEQEVLGLRLQAEAQPAASWNPISR
jgi:hypothetical protein